MRSIRIHVCSLILLALGCFAATRAAGATTNSWVWGGSGFWHHGTNWTAGLGAPGTNTSHVQIIVSGTPKTVLVDPNAALSNLTVNTLIVNSPGSGNSNWLVLSNLNSVAPFRVLAGAVINGRSATQSRLILHDSTMIFDRVSTNSATLSTSNSTILVNSNSSMIFSNGSQAKIGVGASATLNIATNALVQLVNSNFIAGLNPNGVGNVTISGGTLDVGWTFTIGEDPGSTGHVVVANGLLRAMNTNANTEIGQNGGGQLTLSNGVCQFDDVSVGRHDGAHGTFRLYNGLCTGSDLSVGRFTNAYGLFSMTGGQLLFSGNIYIGREGTGVVSVTGGTIQAQDLIVACTNTANGNATFSGGTSLFSSSLCLGSLQSTGNLTISGGAFVCTNTGSTGVVDVIGGSLVINGGNVTFDSVLATNTGGRIVINGGTIAADDLMVNNGLPLIIGNGLSNTTVRLTDGTNFFANGLIVSSNATVVGSGVIYGDILNNGTIIADTTNTGFVFYGAVTNNRTMIQTNGGYFDFRGPLVNNGIIIPKNFMQNRITELRRSGTTNQVFFSTQTGFNYTLQMKTALTNEVWQVIGTIPGDNLTNSMLDTGAGESSRFYRVLIQ
jgi:hypothetical protein